MDPSLVKIPPIKNLSAETITENTILINLERLVSHLHDFARETRLSTKEWMAGLEFLTATGKTCTDVRQVCHGSHL
jgi:protocatechuate 3,4-dioxygenase beta subunit